jgi:hypothetical protein
MPVAIESIVPSAGDATDHFLVRRGAGPLGHTIELLSSASVKALFALAPGDITGLSEAIDDRVAALLVAGTNVTITYDDVLNTLTIDAAGGGGGGSAAGGAATINFGAAPGDATASVVVTGQTGLLTSSRIRAWVQGSTADFNEYEHSRLLPLMVGLGISDVVAGTGFTIHASVDGRLSGTIAIKWEWS